MDLNKTISILEEFTNLVYTYNRTIAGITLFTYLGTYDEDLLAIESVVGPIESADIDIGYRVSETQFQHNNKLFRKIKYMLIGMEVNIAMNPRSLADAIVRRCDSYQENAKSRNMQARISCTVAYPSDGLGSKGTSGSLENFYTFWCRVIENLVDGKKHANIIMQSAFDEGLYAFPGSTNFNPYSTEYYQGWWRRTSDVILDESAYVEKIECKEKFSICFF